MTTNNITNEKRCMHQISSHYAHPDQRGAQYTTDPARIPSTFHDYISGLRDKTKHYAHPYTEEQAEELFFSVVFEQTYNWVYWYNNKQNHLYYCSPSCMRITGYTRDQFFTEPDLINQIIHPEDQAVWHSHQCQLHGDESKEINLRIITRDMQVRWISHFCFPVFDKDGTPLGYRAFIRDITEHHLKAEERCRLAAAVEQAAESIVITDLSGNIVYANPAFEKISGYVSSEIIGKNPRVLKSGAQTIAFYQHMWKTLQSGKVWTGHFMNRKKDGSFYEEEAVISPVRDNNGAIVNFVAVKRDVTHEMLLEKQLRQSQKMEALGTLAGGIAHDFNNILTAIKGYSEILMQNFSEDSIDGTYLREIDSAANRARDLVNQILSFSRMTDQERVPLNICKVIYGMKEMIRRLIPTIYPIDFQVKESVLPISGDAAQLQQVLMNLCTNAYHAMEHKPGPIIIRLQSVFLSPEYVQVFSEITSGNYVLLEVEDQGHGIEPAILDRIFDPFFTTKAVNKGTGLGLAVVDGIVKSHHGVMQVHSEVDKGTVIKIYFPQLDRDNLWTTEDIVSNDTSELKSEQTSILLVDDEPFITKVIRISMERLGFKVTEVYSARAAIDLLESNPSNFDIVITDQSMPEMTGIELAIVLQKRFPELPIILSTGFIDAANVESVTANGIREILHKPFSSADLAKVIMRILN